MSALRTCPLLALRNPEYFGVLGTNSPDWAQIVRTLIFFFVCLFAALSFEGCSQRDRQRVKDDADRRAIVGDWEWAGDGLAPGIMRFSSDGTYWQSNKVFDDPILNKIRDIPSHRSRVLEGNWNITNGELVITYLIGWDGNKPSQPEHVGQSRVVRLIDQELALAAFKAHDVETNFYPTNIYRRAK
jgi:hypothetical protein